MANPPTTRRVRAAFQELSTCNISDALDRLGMRGQVTGILPLWPGCPKIAGPAMPMKLSLDAAYSTVIGTLEAVEACREGDILVIDNGGRTEVNSFGGIATFSAKHYGMSGCVIDGATRDVDDMQSLNFPVFGRGIVNTSVRGRTGFEGYDISVSLGGAEVRPRDFIFADVNGVVVLPAEAVVDVLRWSRRFNAMELRIKREIAAGAKPVTAHKRHRYEEAVRRA